MLSWWKGRVQEIPKNFLKILIFDLVVNTLAILVSRVYKYVNYGAVAERLKATVLKTVSSIG